MCALRGRQPERLKSGYAVHVLSDCVTSYDKTKIEEMLRYYESKGCELVKIKELVG